MTGKTLTDDEVRSLYASNVMVTDARDESIARWAILIDVDELRESVQELFAGVYGYAHRNIA